MRECVRVCVCVCARVCVEEHRLLQLAAPLLRLRSLLAIQPHEPL